MRRWVETAKVLHLPKNKGKKQLQIKNEATDPACGAKAITVDGRCFSDDNRIIIRKIRPF